VIILARGDDVSGSRALWLALSTLIPLFLGLGNVYRTLGWPRGAGPLRLAALTNLAAVAPLALAAWGLGGLDFSPFTRIPGVMAAQLAASTVMFLMFFRLQAAGGPTYLSQIGYVAAVIGVGVGVAWFGETYPPSVWAGAAVVAAGIALTTRAQWRPARR
jgi:drug/metabolite transporter (DMT)-like permease